MAFIAGTRRPMAPSPSGDQFTVEVSLSTNRSLAVTVTYTVRS